MGYTEDVSVTGEKSLKAPAAVTSCLRMYFVDSQGAAFNTDLFTDVYIGLIRGKALAHFDGMRWSAETRANRAPASRAPASHGEGWPAGSGTHSFANLELIREPLTEVLPVPYGVRNLWMFSNSGFTVPKRLKTGEWSDSTIGAYRVRYRAVLDLNESRLPVGSTLEDHPTDDNLFVPAALKSERMLKLAKRLFPEGQDLTAPEKARALGGFFGTGHFGISEGALGESLDTLPTSNAATSGWTELERFLFLRKKGHCELFATAAAMLLRLGGVPTRLVSGFRVSTFPSGGVLSVRSGDAHAWIEYWAPEEGWRPLDVTPRLTMVSSLTGYLREGYETLSNYWYRYIFTFDASRGGDRPASLRLRPWHRWRARKAPSSAPRAGFSPAAASSSSARSSS